MSKFLGIITDGNISLGASVTDVHNHIKADLVGLGYRVVSETIPATPTNDNPTKLFLIPPATEAIGNAQCREVLFMEFGANIINWRPVTEALLPYPQSVVLTPKTGGAASNAVTLAGVTVQQDPATLNAANTASQNLRFLFEALAGSTDPVIQDWDWLYSYPAAQNADDVNQHIYGIRKTAAPNQAIAGTNVTAAIMGNYAGAGLQSPAISSLASPSTVATDLVNGFIYFLQVNARGIALAVRTNASYAGPIHACWGDHARALSLVPDSGKFSKFISPIELLVGTDSDSNNLHAIARPAKLWNRPTKNVNQASAGTTESAHPFSRFTMSEQGFIDCNNISNTSYETPITLQASSMWGGDERSGNDFQVHRVSMSGNFLAMNDYDSTNAYYKTVVVGAILLEDWYKFRGLATDENLQFVADTVIVASLAQTMDGTTDYPVIALDSTAGLAPSGMVVIELEAIEYKGITGNTLTGCTRGKYASARVKHFAGTPVNQGLWFIKINGGALLAGTTKPSTLNP